MTLSAKSVALALAGSALLLLGASLDAAVAMPVAPQPAGFHAPAVNQVMYGNANRRGLHSRTKCGKAPSRC